MSQSENKGAVSSSDEDKFPDESPDFWKDVAKLQEDATHFKEQLQQHMGLFISRRALRSRHEAKKEGALSSFMQGVTAKVRRPTVAPQQAPGHTGSYEEENREDDRSAFHQYQSFVLSHTPQNLLDEASLSSSAPSSTSSSPSLSDQGLSLSRLSDVMHQLSQLQANLDNALDQWHDSNSSVMEQVDAVSRKIADYEDAKGKYVQKMKKYLTSTTVNTKEARFAMFDAKIKAKKQNLEVGAALALELACLVA